MTPPVENTRPQTAPPQPGPPQTGPAHRRASTAPPMRRGGLRTVRPRPTTGRPRLEIDGVRFDPLTEAEVSAYVLDCSTAGHGGLVVTPNVDVLRLLRQPDGHVVATHADIVVADGQPVVWASRLAGRPVPERVAGSSLVRTIARDAAARGHSLYLLGGPPKAAEIAARNLQHTHPHLRIAGTSCPPWGFQDDPDEWAALLAHLRDTRPDVVYLGLGALKQERVALRLREEFPAMWFVGCGASVTFLAGFIPQAPMWMQQAGLEWVHRLSKEPGRLWRRYLVDDIPYALALLGRAARSGRAAP